LREKQNAPVCVHQGASTNTVRSGTSKFLTRSESSCKPTAAAVEIDRAGETDIAYFRARPEARTRIRSATPGEFPRKVLKRARGRQVVVMVAIDRDPVTGEPTRRARAIHFAEGGRA
jgi:hypothetical protein